MRSTDRLPPEVERLVTDLDRRGFLRLAGLGLAAGILPGGCAGVPRALLPPEDLELRVLTSRTYAVFTAAALRIIGPRSAAVVREHGLRLGDLTDFWLARAPKIGERIQTALLALEFGVWPLVGKVRPFTRLDGPAQDRILDELMRSRLAVKQNVFRGIKSFALLAFHFEPASHALTGYPGPFGNDAVTLGDAMTYEVDGIVPTS